jgi:hypothetical protein
VKKNGLIASLLAIAAFVVAPAAAQALEPHWYANGVFIKEAEVVKPVTLTTNITFAVKGEGKAYSTKCAFKGSESVTNPTGAGAGTDEFTEFALTKCKLAKSTTPPCGTFSTPEIIVKVPMATKLATAPKGVILDNLTVTSLEYKCSGTLVNTYTGTLAPKVIFNKTKASAILKFAGATGGELKSGALSMTALGAANIVGPTGKEKITVRTP